jgi:uncharacterized membrane protein YqgA involved in biofilm formation
MLFISIALVIIAAIAGYLVNKHIEYSHSINMKPAIDVGTLAALEERINKFDERINNTWGSISSIKEELNAYKLAMGLKGKN